MEEVTDQFCAIGEGLQMLKRPGRCAPTARTYFVRSASHCISLI